MIYPKKNSFIYWIMLSYAKWLVDRNIREILFNSIETDNNKSILLIANHYSFWDGLILHIVNARLFKKQMHTMILEETAHQYGSFKYAGTFTIKKNSRDVVVSLNYAAKLLGDPKNLVLIYPQGRLYSNFVNHVNFEKGVLRVIKKAQGKFQLVFAAAFVQYYKHQKPTATVYLKTDDAGINYENIDALQHAYQQHYDASKLLQTEADIEK